MVVLYKLLILENSDGSVTAKLPNPAVSWKTSGASDNTILENLQQETVPPGYTVHNWTPGDTNKIAMHMPMSDTFETLLCSFRQG